MKRASTTPTATPDNSDQTGHPASTQTPPNQGPVLAPENDPIPDPTENPTRTITLVAAVATGLPNVQDQGEVSVSFRAKDDEQAQDWAARATHDHHTAYMLTTGLGIHRRTVKPADDR